MVVKDGASEAYKNEFESEQPGIDLGVFSLAEFEEHAITRG